MKRYFSLIFAIAATVSAQIVPSTGNVRGPTSATDNAVARYDGTTGKLIQDSGVTIDDSGNLTVSGGTITLADPNGSFGTITGSYNAGNPFVRLSRVGGTENISMFSDNSTRFVNNSAETARITSTGNLLIGTTTDNGQKLQVNGDGKFSGSVYAEKSGAGFTGQSTGAITQVTTVNSTTYNVTTGSAKVFVVQLSSGDAALCYASYKSSTITILGSDGTIVNSSSPDTGQLGIYKSANNHVISFKTGSNALAGGYGSWGFCFLGNPIISISNP